MIALSLRRHTVALCTLMAICGFFAVPVAARACAEPNRDATITKVQQPDYPQSAKPLGLGPVSVQIEVTVDASGNLDRVRVYKSSGNQAIDDAALAAASRSKYSPRIVNCQAVTGYYLFRADFEPDSAASVPAGSYASVAADLPRGSEWENPFCNGSAVAVPWDEARNAAAYGPSSNTVAVFLWANANADYAARVTLIGNGAAYAVEIPRTPVPASTAGERLRYAYLVSLPSPFSLSYYFVDGAGVDGAPIGDCPSFVKEVAAPTENGSRASSRRPRVSLTSRRSSYKPCLRPRAARSTKALGSRSRSSRSPAFTAIEREPHRSRPSSTPPGMPFEPRSGNRAGCPGSTIRRSQRLRARPTNPRSFYARRSSASRYFRLRTRSGSLRSYQ